MLVRSRKAGVGGHDAMRGGIVPCRRGRAGEVVSLAPDVADPKRAGQKTDGHPSCQDAPRRLYRAAGHSHSIQGVAEAWGHVKRSWPRALVVQHVPAKEHP